MALIGNLKEFSLVNLIQLNCLEKKTAKLTFNFRGKIGVIYFENGEIPHAQYDNSTGPDAMYKVIHLNEGEFKIEEGIRTNLRTNSTKWSELILEGMRLYDESQLGQDEVHSVLIRNLMQVDSVLATVLLQADGNALAHSDFEEVKLYSSMLAFLVSRLHTTGQSCNIGHMSKATINFSDKVLQVYEQDQTILGIFYQPQVDLKRIEPQVMREISNYKSGQL
ncbi:MAG: DUF4388 domain-containing protein [Acidobacteria bacterium]|nr:DUF4388 domain-containing protein [Acidobacteriota bacterium]